MNMITTFHAVPSPTHREREFLAYEEECRAALSPSLNSLLDGAERAGWNRRTAASTLMYLAAQHLRAAQQEKTSKAE